MSGVQTGSTGPTEGGLRMSELTETQLDAIAEIRAIYEDSALAVEMRAKYNTKDREEAASKGEAMSGGSYPIKDKDDLEKAIHAVGRGNASHNSIRKHIMARAKALGLTSMIPDNWQADGSISEAKADDTELETRDADSCPMCDGTGTVEDHECPDCGGTGEFPSPERGSKDDAFEWRKQKAEQMSSRAMEHRAFDTENLEIREIDDGKWTLTGYASVTEAPYEVGFYTERVARGAFKRTLKSDPDVVLLLNHEGLPLARTKAGTLVLEEDRHGLFVEANLDPLDPDAQTLSRKLKRGDLDGQMSFAFIADDQEWNDDFTERTLKAVTINRGDVSIVTQGANPATTATMRSLAESGPAAFEALFQEVRAGRVLSSESMKVLTNVLGLISDADDAVDEAQPMLARIMGVPNPDHDEPENTSEADGEPTPPIASSVTDGRSSMPDFLTRAKQRHEAMQRRCA